MSPAVAEVARWPTAAECWKVPWQFLDELRSCHNQLEATDPRSAVTSFAQSQAVLESLLLHIGFLSFSLGGAELHLMPSAWGFSCRLPGCSSSSCAFFGVRHLQEASQPASNGFSHRLWSLNRTGNMLWPYMKRQHSWLFTHCSLQKLQAADVKNMPFSPLTNALQQSDHLLIAQEHLLITKGCQKFQFWLKTRVSTYVLTPRCGGARWLAEEGPPGMCVGVCTNRLMLGTAPIPAVGISKSPRVQGMGFTCSEGAGWDGWCGQNVPHPGLLHRQEGGGRARPSGSARPGDTGRASPAASSLARIFTRNVKKNNREINKKPSDLTQLEYLFWKIYWIREQETH